MHIAWFHRLLDVIAPRYCPMCGSKLSVTERPICTACRITAPYTDFERTPYDNPMARDYWGKIEVEKCAALLFYRKDTGVSRLIHELKYYGRPDIAMDMGRIAATKFARYGFFDGIDALVPVPLTKRRQRERRYNQSERIARGIAEVTGIKVETRVLKRTAFKESQTHKSHEERRENVEKAFTAVKGHLLEGKHVLLIDDVITTGSTTTECAKALKRIPGIRISILALSFTSKVFVNVNRETPEEYRRRMNIPLSSLAD